ncbi:AAA family ATPase [Amycolatopsis sp. FDAARGOS 1241]|uniref:ATP-binding protein n=1 Tax=Amycolatopsis sp. FDAARGOS 1241 TaxID=2778070 RepID=UPI00194E8CA2|nr:LuxR family transcriptional regulator [Amycolatopsis sp. FDAARGOS 1241]QRP45803.1 AAA family ATPase [Amycolatopsis sp. FDAARGOS 1241]
MWQAVPRPTSVTVRTGLTAFSGRDHELTTMVEVLGHRPAAVLVEGEPGMGRSRVLAELARRREFAGGRVLRGTCQPLREPFPYGPVLEALRAAGDRPLGPLSPVAGALRPLLPELADQLPPSPEPLDDPGAQRHRVFRAVRELLVACGPTIMLVDDLQWADEGTGDLMRFLAADLPPELAVVAAYRSGPEPWPGPLGAPVRAAPTVHTARVALGPLDVEAVRAMAVDVLELPRVSDEFAAKLHECTGGIPFVVEETVRALRNAPLPAGEGLSDRLLENLEMPAALRESVTERLAALPEQAAQLTRAAAVLAVPAEPATLGDVAGLAEESLRTALLAALGGGLLAELGENRYGFRHPLARKAVYDTVSGPERTLLHTEAMRVLDTLPSPPSLLLAQHAHAAGRTQKWLRYAEAAADEAIGKGETSRAIDLLQAALPASDDVGRLATKLSQVALRGFRPDVIETLERVLEDQPLPPAVRGTIRLSLGMLLVRTIGRLERGREEVERAVAELVDRPELAARGINLLAQPIDGLTPLSWHEGWMRRAREVHSGLTDPELRLALTVDRIANASHLGDGSAWAEFEALPDAGESVGERVQLARLWCNLSDAQSWAGHLDRAARLVEEGSRRATDAGALYAIGLIQGTQARLAWFRGEWDGLAETAEDVRSRYPELGPVVMDTSLVLGGLAAVRGEFAAAQRHLARASVHAPGDGPIPVVLCAASVLIGVLLAGDDVAGACSVADVAVDAARRKGVWVWAASLVPTAADAYTRAGRWSDADAFVEEFARGVAGRDSPLAVASLHAGRAVLTAARGKHLAAAAAFDSAAAAYTSLPMPYLATSMAERAACLRLLAGQRSAVDALASAAGAFEQLGATRDAGRCHHLLRSHGAWAPSQRGRRGYGRELSPREREVARMLAEGRTNREIADGLFLSPRTVEQHVAKVLRKLGARGRTDVARHLPADGAAVG